MQMSLTIDAIGADLAAVGELGDDNVAEVAERIGAVLSRSLPGRLLDLISEVAVDVTAALPEGRLEVRVSGDDVDLVYVPDEEASPAGRKATCPLASRCVSARDSNPTWRTALPGRASRSTPPSSVRSSAARLNARPRAVGAPASGATDPPERREHMERTFDTPKPVRLVVENESGQVTVAAVRRGDHLGLGQSRDPERRGVGGAHDHRVPSNGGQPHGGGKGAAPTRLRVLRGQAVSAVVELPEGSDIEVATAAADIEVTGTVGAADLKTASGDVSTDDIGAGLRAATASGNVIVGTVTGRLRMRSASGDLRCTRVTGRVDSASASGDVEIGAADNAVEVHGTSGHVRLGELHAGAKVANVSGNVRVLSLGEGSLLVRSVSGDVAVGVPAGVDLSVDVSTMGSFRSDIAIEDAPTPGASGTKVDLSISSVTGNVEIERAFEHVA